MFKISLRKNDYRFRVSSFRLHQLGITNTQTKLSIFCDMGISAIWNWLSIISLISTIGFDVLRTKRQSYIIYYVLKRLNVYHRIASKTVWDQIIKRCLPEAKVICFRVQTFSWRTVWFVDMLPDSASWREPDETRPARTGTPRARPSWCSGSCSWSGPRCDWSVCGRRLLKDSYTNLRFKPVLYASWFWADQEGILKDPHDPRVREISYTCTRYNYINS